MMRAVGFGDEDFEKPIIGVANGYSTVTPCNMGLNDLAERAISSLRAAGTMPRHGLPTVVPDRAMAEHLQQGDCVAIFPEGTRTRHGGYEVQSRLSRSHC